MITNDTYNLEDYNVWTANDIAKITGGNYRTVKRILLEKENNNEITSTSVSKNNRIVQAYYVNNNTIKSIQVALKDIRNKSKQIAPTVNVSNNTISYKDNKDGEVVHNANDKENVTIYEVINLQKKNNELENQIVKLKLEVKDLEMRNTVLDSDNKVKDKELLLITDKSKEFEKNYFEKVQEIQNLQEHLKHRNILLIVLSAIMLIVITIASTIAFIR